MPHVSIVIPFTQVDAYLAECLGSLIHLNDEDVDLVLVYDRIFSLSEESRLEGLIQKLNIKSELLFSTNAGLPACLNMAINQAKGEYICRLDSDDVMIPNRVQLQREYLDHNSDVAVIGGQILYINEMGLEIPNRKSRYPVGKTKTRESFETGCYLAHPAVMMRKSCVLELGGYRPQFLFAEDYDLWLRILDKYEIDNLSDQVIKYREHAGQSSRKMDMINLYSMAAVMSRDRRRSRYASDLPDYELSIWAKSEVDELNKENEGLIDDFGNRNKTYLLEIQLMNAKKFFREGEIIKSIHILFKISQMHPIFFIQKAYYFVHARLTKKI